MGHRFRIPSSSFPPPAPAGRFMGELSPFSAHKLGSCDRRGAGRANSRRSGFDEVSWQRTAGRQGQAPGRQAARGAKLPDPPAPPPFNKVCAPA